MNKLVLFVDDEPHVLESIARNLNDNDFEVHTAESAAKGLDLIDRKGPFAVVISDMRMPVMNGSAFLSLVRGKNPDTVRILLTGYAEINTAISAVNDGQIFRFLTKPCPLPVLYQTLMAGLEQYRLVTSERELLEKTLTGSITILTEILSMIEPQAFGRAEEIKAAAELIAQGVPEVPTWELQMAAMLARIGQVVIPQSTIAKLGGSKMFSPEENEMLERIPLIGQNLIKNIPRLEGVAQIVYYQNKHFDGTGYPPDTVAGKNIPLGARFLKVLNDMLELTAEGMTRSIALATMRQRPGWYDPKILSLAEQYLVALPTKEVGSAFSATPNAALFFSHTQYKPTSSPAISPTTASRSHHRPEVSNSALTFGKLGNSSVADSSTYTTISLRELRVGHILAANLEAKNGIVLLTAGKPISELQLERIQNAAKISGIKEPIKIMLDTRHKFV